MISIPLRGLTIIIKKKLCFLPIIQHLKPKSYGIYKHNRKIYEISKLIDILLIYIIYNLFIDYEIYQFFIITINDNH